LPAAFLKKIQIKNTQFRFDGDYLFDPFTALNYGAYWDDLLKPSLLASAKTKITNDMMTAIMMKLMAFLLKRRKFFEFIERIIALLEKNILYCPFKIIAGHDYSWFF
jgi:hypothetical protein